LIEFLAIRNNHEPDGNGLVSSRGNKAASNRLMSRLFKRYGCPFVLATDALHSYVGRTAKWAGMSHAAGFEFVQGLPVQRAGAAQTPGARLGFYGLRKYFGPACWLRPID
jgi:hypothetical protein